MSTKKQHKTDPLSAADAESDDCPPPPLRLPPQFLKKQQTAHPRFGSEEFRRQLQEGPPPGRPYFKRTTPPPGSLRQLFLTSALFDYLGRDEMEVDVLADGLISRFSEGGHAADQAFRNELYALIEDFVQAKKLRWIGSSIAAC